MAKKSSGPLGSIIDFLSSMGLASALLVNLFMLTLCGTLAQVDDGIYQVQKEYFESWFVMARFFGLVIPMPGAVSCMALLGLNLLLGGFIRIRKNKSTYGVIIVHVGIAVMLAASLTKMTASDEGRITLYEGESTDEFIHYHDWEVAVFDVEQQTQVKEWIIPHEQLADLMGNRTRTFEFPDLGLEFELSNFVENGRPMPKGPNWKAVGPTIDGFAIQELPFEAEAAERNLAGVIVTAQVGGVTSQGILWPFSRYPWVVKVGDKEIAVSLRHRRMSMPFGITLDKFTRELHPGTGMAKVYSSDVTKTVLTTSSSQKLKISMNEPLRSEGLVLFQSSWGPADAEEGAALYSQFSVVRNPSDSWPLYSCIIITIGMLIAFGQKLVRYIENQGKKRAKELEGVTA